MYQQTLAETGFVLLPVLAMLLFATVFLVAMARAWRRGESHPDHTHAAALPLESDDRAHSAVPRTPTREEDPDNG